MNHGAIAGALRTPGEKSGEGGQAPTPTASQMAQGEPPPSNEAGWGLAQLPHGVCADVIL